MSNGGVWGFGSASASTINNAKSSSDSFGKGYRYSGMAQAANSITDFIGGGAGLIDDLDNLIGWWCR